jgi:thioredoxin 1
MPCRMLAPTIDKIAKDYAGKVKVGKLDTDANRDVSIKYGISAIPTVILFKGGQVVQKFVGLRQERDFKEALDNA